MLLPYMALAAMLDMVIASHGRHLSATRDATIVLSNRITACPDKVERQQELLVEFVKQVKKHEPGVLKFLVYVAPDQSSFLTFEKYASAEAITVHLNTTYIKELVAAEDAEGTKCAENQVLKPLDDVFGFTRSQTVQ